MLGGIPKEHRAPMSTGTDAIAAAEKTIEQQLKPGWVKRFVEPPWRGATPGLCRGCGRTGQQEAILNPKLKWATVAIVKEQKERKILWYSFALCCEVCAKDRKVMNRLAVEVFDPGAPEAGLPPIDVTVTDTSKPDGGGGAS
jgi:hypothetical protein